MEIIKRGKTASDKKWKGTCRSCSSEAIATESEMNHITRDQRESTSFSWEVCPVCQKGDKKTGYGGMIFYPVK